MIATDFIFEGSGSSLSKNKKTTFTLIISHIIYNNKGVHTIVGDIWTVSCPHRTQPHLLVITH